LGSCQDNGKNRELKTGDTIPAFTLRDQDGNWFNSRDHLGRNSFDHRLEPGRPRSSGRHLHHQSASSPDQLVSELGYRRQDDTWLTALSVNSKKSGLSKSELDMVEGIVKWQMEALKGQ